MPTSEAALLGRLEEMAALRAALERVHSGHPGVVFVSGEVGVGKTRLVGEFVHAVDARVLAGGCVPVAGQALTFAPFTQALRRLAATLSEEGRDGLLDDIPGDLTPLLAPGTEPASEQTSPLELPVSMSAQLRLFESMLGLLTELASQRSVILVIEDLHWADQSSLDLLAFLAHNVSDQRVLIVSTYRTHETDADTALSRWVAELARLPLTTRVPLTRLGGSDVERLVTQLSRTPPEPEQLRLVLARADGNPLFVEHLVAASHAGVVAIPETLHDLLATRVATLDGSSRRTLRAMSVLGRQVPVELLARVTDEQVTVVEEQLRPALAAFVVEVTASGRLGFRHPLFAEVVYAELLPGERAALHRRAAEVLSEGSQTATAAAASEIGEAARHWQEAGDLSRALRGAVDAGVAATRVYAFADALESFRRAIRLWDQVPSSEHAQLSLDHVELLAQSAQAASLVGEATEAISMAQRAIDICTDPGRSDSARSDPARSDSADSDPGREAQLYERLGAFHFIAGHAPESAAAYRSAIALLPAEPGVLRARVYARQALLSAAWNWFDEAVEAAGQALDAARAVDAKREEGIALNALGVVESFRGDFDTGLGHMREALTIAGELDNPDDQAIAYINLTHLLGMAGKWAEAVDTSAEGFATLTRVGLVRQYGTVLLANSAESLIKLGRLDEADTLLTAGLRQHARGVQGAALLVQCGRLALVRADLDLAWDWFDQARLRMDDEGAPDAWRRELWEAVAELELWEGRPLAASEAVSEGLRLLGDDEDRWIGGQLAALGLRAVADEAAMGRSLPGADRAAAQQRQTAMLDAADRLLGQPSPTVEYVAWDATGHAERARLQKRGDALALWVDAGAHWTRLDRPFLATYCGWREAEARLSEGDTAAGVDALRRASRGAAALAAHRLTGEIDALARWYKLDAFVGGDFSVAAGETDTAAGQGKASRAGDVADPAERLTELGLTPREQEVLTALAAGRTNGEIAEDLFISVKTASVHVSNILRKLEVSGRQDAARVAHRLGLRL